MNKIIRRLADLIIACLTFASFVSGVQGAITVSSLGSDQYLADIGTLTFNVTSPGDVRIVTVEDFYIGPNTDISSTPLISNISYSLNGASFTPVNLATNSGSYGDTYGLWDPNDFLFATVLPITVTEGDTLAFTGTFTFEATGLTSHAVSVGDLTAYLSNISNTVAMSESAVAVPEPSSALFLGVLALGFATRYCRKYKSDKIS